ncbi:MAG: hypothetical protein ACR2QM_16905 [Longimicrobiales bacterium]
MDQLQMGTFQELKERRIVQIVVSYAATGYIVLEVLSQLIENGIIPGLVYSVALVWFLVGMLAALVVGWNHGEKGHQKSPKGEIAFLGLLGVVALVGSGFVIQRSGEQAALAAGALEGGLNPNRIAVLYLEDLTSRGDLEYAAGGLTEALISQLRAVESLDVVTANGSAQFKGTDTPRDSIATVLEAGTLVTGTVDRSRDDVDVTLALVDGNSGIEFRRANFSWAEDELVQAQAELAEETAGLLREWLGSEVELRRLSAGTESSAAWALVQRAERAFRAAQESALHGDAHEAGDLYLVSDSLLAQAEEADPDWVEPIVRRARAGYELARLESDPFDMNDLLDAPLEHARRALLADGENADALEVAGTVRYLRWLFSLEPDPAASEQLLLNAEEDLIRATELNPRQAGAWNVLAHFYYQRDDILEANLAARRAYEADAYNVFASDILWRLWSTSYDLENHPQARTWCVEAVDRFPDNPRFYECELSNMTSRGADPNPDRAWELVDEVANRTPEGHQREMARRHMQALAAGVLGRAEMADSARAVLDRIESDPEVDPNRELFMFKAFAAVLAEDQEGAVEYLRSYLAANPDRREGFAEHGHWWWRPLQSNPEFQRLVGG